MKLAVDIDEVVAAYVQAYCDYPVGAHGGKLNPEKFEKYSFSATLGITPEESDETRTNFLNSNHFDEMKLIEGAKDAINFLSRNHEITFITARPEDHKEKTLKFFDKYFPGHKFNVIFSGDFVGGKKKDEICKELGINVIIEDSDSSFNYAKEGIRVLLFDKPWNVSIDHENVIRCYNWREILMEVEKLSNGN